VVRDAHALVQHHVIQNTAEGTISAGNNHFGATDINLLGEGTHHAPFHKAVHMLRHRLSAERQFTGTLGQAQPSSCYR
jgi:hypothetical protein